MFKKYARIAIALVLLVVLLWLNNKPVQILKMHRPTLQQVTESSCEISTAIEFNNPNLLSATLNKLDIHYLLAGKEIGSVEMMLETGIPGLKTSTIPINARVPFAIGQLLDAHGPVWQLQTVGSITYHSLGNKGQVQLDFIDSITINK